ncbi:hypothetical protein P22_0094 [Propionispora sp. 2/2-37]|uniref:UDP-N-acetylmuramoyl-tripeptide--D-alanyl-D- alanine ligase n=1 Tax=Propionispora sp. 2/2-37 TaxID=1677858 RepID=UPI0006BB7888|nr:UDP-N-acetylmuramoyl-tripeptide--D-alanyl-D-alanine ligase [Propionispora sp. 2/2-37]CUH94032.1 hypothetical protein P22_0094 [Propionispora sp. 2/2-37]
MAEFTIEEVSQAVGNNLNRMAPCDSAVRFTGVSTDTRSIHPGDLFVALIGERFDGHNFITQAVQKGAAGVLVSKAVIADMDEAAPCVVITVQNTLAALQQLAKFHRSRYSIPVIAVTGSNGKTTTKDMTAAVLSRKYKVLKTEANYNNEIGLPLTLLQLTSVHEAAVVEMGMRGLGEIKELAGIALPNMAIVTNVGETHLELLGSLENIAAAKSELVESIPPEGVVVLNGDNHYVRQMGGRTKARLVTYGLTPDSAVWADNIGISNNKEMVFACHCLQETFPVSVPTVGRHNVYNALAAVAVGCALGLNAQEIREGLSTFQASGMRLHIEKKAGYTLINDAYNASPMSMAAAIATLAEIAGGRKVAVLGDMLELGNVAETAHRHIGELLARYKVDIVITVGRLAGSIADAAQAGGVKTVIACENHAQAMEELRQLMDSDDTILIKGSRGMKMEKIAEIFG